MSYVMVVSDESRNEHFFPLSKIPTTINPPKAKQCEVGDDDAKRLGHLAEHARLRHVRHVDEDVVRGVAVEWGAQTLLVEVVTDEADAAAKDEETVESTDLDVLVRLLRREGTAVTEQVDEADGDTAVNDEDEGVLLGRRHFLDGQCIVEQAVAREILPYILLDELYTQIRIIDTLDLVADTRDCSTDERQHVSNA